MAATRRDNARELILETTQALLDGNLLRDISLASIAEKAGVSKGTIYYYFKAKEDLLFAVMDKHLNQQRDDLIAWSEDPGKDSSLPRMVKYIIERDIASAGMRLQFFCDALSGNDQVRDELLSRYGQFAALIANKLAERTDKVSSEYLSWLLLVIADGLLLQTSLNNPDIDIAQFLKQTQELVRLLPNQK